ncbi:hypothetical protein [Sporosarcina obsidiansis]|uniref:hypothetical protein n=1 Tax=Sporosarcina obsidiansis TaxID=2660748 RepID=UPI00129A2428|nr:hypothetical protein [Sporosarcina obsidiansis]
MNGIIYYQETQYLYVVKSNKLILNRTKDSSSHAYSDVMSFFQEDTTEVPACLIGFDFTTNRNIKFYITSMFQTKICCYECSFFSYLLFDDEIKEISKIQVEDGLLTNFHLYDDGLVKSFDFEDYAYKIKLNAAPDKFEFQIHEHQVYGELSSLFYWSSKKLQPYQIKTSLAFKFSATNDIQLIDNLLYNLNEFMHFITNTNRQKILKANLYDNNKKIGVYIINEVHNHSTFEEMNTNIIPFGLIKNSLGSLFNNIANTKVYTNHIKEFELNSGNLTYSRIIMLAAGFEWQFNYLNYPVDQDIQKKIEYKKTIESYLDSKINVTQGNEKKYYKNIKKLINRDLESLTLSKKIRYALKNHEEILKPFIFHLYKLNHLDYPKIHEVSERIASTRNIVAHGNLSKNIHENAVLDYQILQFLYYAMILKSLDLPTINIQKAIKNLFKVNISLE